MTNSNTPVAFWNQSQRKTKLKYALKWPNKLNKLFSIGLLCGLLAGVTGTVLVAWYFLSPSEYSTTVASPSAVCDVTPLGEPTASGPGYYTARFVAYGDMDSDDDVPCGMLPEVRIAVIHEKRGENVMQRWWEAVGGSELLGAPNGYFPKNFPPGVRVPTAVEKIATAPAQFIDTVNTGPDGTAEVSISHNREQRHSLCAIASTGDLIAGCIYDFPRKTPEAHITVYIYFTHGHAVIEEGSSDRYQRFLDGANWTGSPATVTFEATLHDDIGPSRPFDDVDVIIVDDAHVNAWWAAVSDNGANGLDAHRLRVDPKALAHDWVHVVTTGPDGLAETALPSGDYLICVWSGLVRCIYHNLTSGDHKFLANFGGGGNLLGIIKRVERKPTEPDCDSPFHGLTLGALERHLIECAEEAEGR